MINKFIFKRDNFPYLRNTSKYMPLRAAIVYVLAGVLWILFSDKALFILVKNTDMIESLQILKGLIFVAITAYLFYRISMDFVKYIYEYNERLKNCEDELKGLNEKIYAAYEELNNKEETIKFWKEKFGPIVEGAGDAVRQRMKSAIENDEFYLLYQPQIDVMTGEITSLEALIRWDCPEYGIVKPVEFIPIAEESGFIIQIGEWVLKKVCMQCKEWRSKGYKFDYIGVNISPVQLKYHGFLDTVKEILSEASTNISDLEFEITENVLIEPFHLSIEILTKLQQMGTKIALDDFGTGYSSLKYLRMLPINSLKIDKTFIDNVCIDTHVISIVDGIISLAHKMDLTVTAEGVETEEQFNILKEKHCDKIQGYFISKPLSKYEVERLLQKQS